MAGLTWDSLRLVGNECHFEIIGKWGIERWFRLPEAVYQELLGFRTSSPFVFAAYTEQLRQFQSSRPNLMTGLKAEFSPKRFGSWFYQRVVEWSKTDCQGAGIRSYFSQDHLAARPARRGHSPPDRQRSKGERIRPHDQLRQGNGRGNAAAKQSNLPAYPSQPLVRSGDSLRSCSRCPFGNGKSTTSGYRCPRLGDGIRDSQTDGPSFVKSCEIRNGWRKCCSLQQKRRCRKFLCDNAL